MYMAWLPRAMAQPHSRPTTCLTVVWSCTRSDVGPPRCALFFLALCEDRPWSPSGSKLEARASLAHSRGAT